MRIVALNYGPVTVVRDLTKGVAHASADGPAGVPSIVTCSADLSDGRIILLAVAAAEAAWSEAGGMPEKVRRAFETVVAFDPLRLIMRRGTDGGKVENARLYSRQ